MYPWQILSWQIYILCFVHKTSLDIETREDFIPFEVVDGTAGQGLSERIKSLQLLKRFCPAVAKDITDGHKRGQAGRWLKNPDALFNPYGSYNLNLHIGNVAKSSVAQVNF